MVFLFFVPTGTVRHLRVRDSLRFTRPSVRGTVCVECSTFSPRTCLGRHIGLPLHYWCFCCLRGQARRSAPCVCSVFVVLNCF